MAKSENMRPIGTGGVWFYLTNIFIVKAGSAWALVIRPGVLLWGWHFWRTQLMILTERNRSNATAKAKRSTYVARLAQNADEVRHAQRLRFEVFNLELGEGLAESHATGLDVDPFDEFCDHLIVEETPT